MAMPVISTASYNNDPYFGASQVDLRRMPDAEVQATCCARPAPNHVGYRTARSYEQMSTPEEFFDLACFMDSVSDIPEPDDAAAFNRVGAQSCYL